jgi:hypothetical protein
MFCWREEAGSFQSMNGYNLATWPLRSFLAQTSSDPIWNHSCDCKIWERGRAILQITSGHFVFCSKHFFLDYQTHLLLEIIWNYAPLNWNYVERQLSLARLFMLNELKRYIREDTWYCW